MKALLKASAALALGMVLIAPSARAQGAEFSLGGGATVPLADFADATKTGWNGMAGISFVPGSFPLGIQIDGMYQRLKFDDAISTDLSTQILQGTANLVYKFKTSEESTFRPYLIGGVGVYNFKAVGGDDVSAPGEGNTSTDFGLNGGAGFDIKTSGIGLFVEGRFHNVFTDGSDAQFIPITLGIRLGGD
jgi:opacity protein-like surface antigen